MAEGEVFNQEHRHTSLIATLREQWNLGDPFTARDAAARTFSHAFTLDTPGTRYVAGAGTAPGAPFIEDALALGKILSTLGKTLQGIRGYAEQNNIEIEGLPKDPKADPPQTSTAHHQLPRHHIPPAGPGRSGIACSKHRLIPGAAQRPCSGARMPECPPRAARDVPLGRARLAVSGHRGRANR